MRSVGVGEVKVIALTDVEVPFFRLDQIFSGVRHEELAPTSPAIPGPSPTSTPLGASSGLTC